MTEEKDEKETSNLEGFEVRDENEQPFQSKERDPIAQEKIEKSIAKIQAIKALRDLSGSGKGEWNLLQEIMQDICATHMLEKPDREKLPPMKQLIEEMKAEIEKRYNTPETKETKEILFNAIPSELSIRQWFKKETWQDAVWARMRKGGLFSNERRATLINALWERGTKKDTNAAKLWLTLSGDYSEAKVPDNDKSIDIYRQIQETIFKKKSEE